MPWRETSVMDERLRFVARLLEGEGMSEVCRSFGISRKTDYKIFNRYKEDGLEALTDRSRRPVRYANQLPRTGRGDDRSLQAGEAALGRAQDARASGPPAGQRRAHPGEKHGACTHTERSAIHAPALAPFGRCQKRLAVNRVLE